ncbi:NB-ARC domain-containing protein [Streptomyces sp. NPDC097619]|uniref:ATP-binding protein n=1 Tax=Streptomyces sp. NPDC097619 TaxID=3157228 RepID=UPI00332AC9DE
MLGNLPSETASFVGRGAELDRLAALLRDRRLITLTGAGGVGKSRLALRAAHRARPSYPDGTWWVELSPLRDPGLLSTTVAHTLGLAEQSLLTSDEELCAWVRDKRLLLVLDTCEHLVDRCRHLVAELLQSAPELTVVVTSRQPLGATAEWVTEVRPLPVAGPDSDALALFRARALAAGPRAAAAFADPGRTATAVEVCRRLDGIPLALELAGARLRLWTLEEVADRLGARFDLLTDTRSARLPRHRTMRTAIGWSHELCEPLERLLWARLSVFAGEFTLAAARAVCAGGPLPASQVQRVLTGLVGKSVVRRTVERTRERYRMLDTIREYGRAWLAELGEEERTADRHAHWYAALAREAGRGWLGPEQVHWQRRLTDEHTELRAALEHLLDTDPRTALELAGDLWFFWICCGRLREGRGFLERALTTAPEPGPAHAQALWTLGTVAMLQGDFATALDRGRAAAAQAASLADPELAARCSYVLAVSVLMPGEPARALEVSAAPVGGADEDGAGRLLCRLATAYALCDLGRHEEATEEAAELRAACARLGETWLRAYADYVLAVAALGAGRPGDADRHVRSMLSGKRLLDDSFGIAIGLDLLAAAVAAQGDGELAARLLGTGAAVWRTVGRPQMGSPSLTALRDGGERRARAAIGDAAFERAFRAGVAEPAP